MIGMHSTIDTYILLDSICDCILNQSSLYYEPYFKYITFEWNVSFHIKFYENIQTYLWINLT